MGISIQPISQPLQSPLEILKARNATHASNSSATSTAVSSSDSSASISDSARFYSRIEELKPAQPAKVLSALTNAASGLSAAAKQAGTSTPLGQLLAKSAATVQQVANTGDVSQLQPAAATNLVEKAYGPNQATSGQAVLSLLSSATSSPSSANASVIATPNLFGTAGKQDKSSATSVAEAVSSVLSDLQKALTS